MRKTNNYITHEEKRTLIKRLTDPIEKFSKLGDTTDTLFGPLTYIDRGGDILAVAHLDYVKWNPKPNIRTTFKNTRITNCPQLDDRLGAWMCIDILPLANCKCDVLLTDSEEIGQSTAKYFNPTKDYNWIVEFDRAGSDTVMYEYEDTECKNLLRDYNIQTGYGSFTDICDLEHLKCKGFNFGVGYHDQHTDLCYANLSETFASFTKFLEFYKDWKDCKFEHTIQEQVIWNHRPKHTNPYTTLPTTYSGKKPTKYSGPMGFQTQLNNSRKKNKKQKKQKHQQIITPQTSKTNIYKKTNNIQLVKSWDNEREELAETLSQNTFGMSYSWLNPHEKDIIDTHLSKINY